MQCSNELWIRIVRWKEEEDIGKERILLSEKETLCSSLGFFQVLVGFFFFNPKMKVKDALLSFFFFDFIFQFYFSYLELTWTIYTNQVLTS